MKKQLEKAKGITLIALVITIIVLLILAGVSMATLTGEGGILSKATTAQEKDEQAQLEEQVKLAIMAARMQENPSIIDLNVLYKELTETMGFKDSEIAKSENGELPWTITHNGFEYRITKGGGMIETTGVTLVTEIIPKENSILVIENNTKPIEVTTTPSGNVESLIYKSKDESIAKVDTNGVVTGVSEGETTIDITGAISTDVKATVTVTVSKGTAIVTAAEIAKNPELYYGKRVTNYMDNASYRIFYVDKQNYFKDGENTVYLKADYDAGRKVAVNNGNSWSGTIHTSETLIRKLNPMWSTAMGNGTVYSGGVAGSAAWLCDPVNSSNYETTMKDRAWTPFFKNGVAEYVVSGPSVEMYIRSYNDVPHKGYEDKVLGCYCPSKKTDGTGYLYTVNNAAPSDYPSGMHTGKSAVDYEGYGDIYKSEGEWRLCSPSYYDIERRRWRGLSPMFGFEI